MSSCAECKIVSLVAVTKPDISSTLSLVFASENTYRRIIIHSVPTYDEYSHQILFTVGSEMWELIGLAWGSGYSATNTRFCCFKLLQYLRDGAIGYLSVS